MSEAQNALAERIMDFYDDPLGYILFAFPWGEKGTSLEKHDGPDQWQVNMCQDLQKAIRKNLSVEQAMRSAIRVAVRSGHGIGKTAFTSWIILWFMSTRPNPQVVVTAGTGKQLSSKTWRELSKWKDLAINGYWFDWTATQFYLKEKRTTWCANAITWSEHRSDAFAGTHEENVLVIYDEASSVADIIWEVTEGAMTTPGAMWIVFGNPVRNTGRFRECFRKFAHRWLGFAVDSRQAKMANKREIDQWIEDYGEDSDFVRVRIKGEFPRAASNQFIGQDIVDRCQTYDATGFERFTVRIGVDVARYGDDETVILVRQGRKKLSKQKFRGLDVVAVAKEVISTIEYHIGLNQTVKVFVDGVGIGGGVVDVLRDRGYMRYVVDVSQQAADDDERYFNKRAEMWGRMRDFLKRGMNIANPDGTPDIELAEDITSVEYGFSNKNQIQLEKKEDLKKRLGRSPDDADALALTFAYQIADTVDDAAGAIAQAHFKKIGGGLSTNKRWRK